MQLNLKAASSVNLMMDLVVAALGAGGAIIAAALAIWANRRNAKRQRHLDVANELGRAGREVVVAAIKMELAMSRGQIEKAELVAPDAKREILTIGQLATSSELADRANDLIEEAARGGDCTASRVEFEKLVQAEVTVLKGQ